MEERFALLVERQWTWRQNLTLERRLRDCRLQGPDCIEDIGPTGIGKTLLARAFGPKACRDGFTAYFATAAQLFRELKSVRADGSYAKRLRASDQVDVLLVDDWAMAPLGGGGTPYVPGDVR